jgi:Tfp pilus assembly protein FimT
VNRSSYAFTFLEMVVVLLLIGVIATVFIPKISRRSPTAEWSNVLDDLNNLVFFARQEAISNQRVYRLVFQSRQNAPDTVRVEQENDDPEKPGRKIYTPVSSYYFSATYQFSDQLKLKAVYSGKYDTLAEQRGNAFCYVIPDGLVQDIAVQITRRIDSVETGGTYRMNPFFGKFEFYDGYVKPEV